MNIRTPLKKNLKLFFKEQYYIMIAFVLLPLIITLMFGMMMEDSFKGEGSLKPVTIGLSYDEQSTLGKILANDLKKQSIKELITVDAGNPECEVVIKEDFKEIQITNRRTTTARTELVREFFETFLKHVSEQDVMEEKITKEQLGQKQEAYLLEMRKLLGALQSAEGVEERIVEGYKTLTSYEYYALSLFSFTSMLLILIFINLFIDERNQGIVTRSNAAPYEKSDYVMGFTLSMGTIAFLINSSYVVVIRCIGIGFKENILGILFILILQSLMQGAVAMLIVSFVKTKMLASMVTSVMLLIPAIIGGVFTNVEQSGSQLTQLMGRIAPNTLILNSYKSLALSGKLEDAVGYLLPMLIVSLMCLLGALLKVQVKGEI